MARPDKVEAVDQIAKWFSEANAAVLTEYRGLSVTQLRELRGALRANADYTVVKNTLTKIAVKQAGIDGLDDALQGPTAVAFVTGDPVDAAKALRDFSKSHHALVIKAGVMDAHAMTAADVGKLADLDSREVTLAKLAGVVKAGMAKAAATLAAPASKAVRTIDALRDKQEQAAA
ncbi:MAG: 50S ribosomal protein L10 [Micrococcales bacterium]|nr:50S ribosomal protein L10 [Micrococcales bacterium]